MQSVLLVRSMNISMSNVWQIQWKLKANWIEQQKNTIVLRERLPWGGMASEAESFF